ncbi:Crp/Fnr family transcriptional regulator [Bradyrhizobium diazoefficiens]|jgi:CRP-like cAMP-binding protein|nr:Crp/Fnr family transcriptional regulator [Bradyrhizobium diazoefficiens]MBR0980293.1 Crp/Fnr family transcriptional regulator [Bradyrhizobium diazoefficiens]MBR1016224.1 Crp/Fnr family transcriptional regulator [Bradyrhizobium diazoefficiens]MBR1117574.1 Crp/Fnr family transcriptional regulator [Bradyrhizobium diazoefficiens]
MDSQHVSPNRLLAHLSPGDFDLVRSHLRTIDLVHAAELVAAGDEMAVAYFPHGGIISLIVRLTGGEATEIAMIGRDSVFGASAALVGPTALTTAVIQSPGACSVLPVKRLKEAADHSPTLRTMLIRHEQAIFVQAQQSAGCMASHPAMARLARWLLRARDAGGSDEMDFTQEFLGQMLGVRRNAVSSVAVDLQNMGVIRFNRGQILITDPKRLEAVACECYDTVRNELDQLKRSPLNP